jgi:ribonuclease III
MILKRRKRQGIEAILGVKFSDRELLRRALTHRSYAHEASLGWDDTNERLEFLGDAVLDLIISDYMYLSHTHLDEGELTRIRSYLVNMNSLAVMARELGIGPHILLSRDERADGGDEKASILADTLEALIGAVYIDKGVEAARRLVLRLVRERLDEALSGPLDFD